MGTSGLSATGASDSGGGAAWLVCPSDCCDPPRHAVRTQATSNIDRTSGTSIFPAPLPRHVVTSLQQLEDLPRARDDRSGQSREPADVNAIGAVGATRLQPVQEHDFLADLAHRHVEVSDVLELLGELR